MAFCSSCGKELEEGAAFCSGCGARLGGVPNESVIAQPMASAAQTLYTKEIVGNFSPVESKIPLPLTPGEVPIEQYSAALVKSSIAQGTFTLTNKRILFQKDGAGKSFLKRGGLLGMALNEGANIPPEIPLDRIVRVEPTSCLQGKAAFIVTDFSGTQYKFALQSMRLSKTKELCEMRDRIVSWLSGIL